MILDCKYDKTKGTCKLCHRLVYVLQAYWSIPENPEAKKIKVCERCTKNYMLPQDYSLFRQLVSLFKYRQQQKKAINHLAILKNNNPEVNLYAILYEIITKIRVRPRVFAGIERFFKGKEPTLEQDKLIKKLLWRITYERKCVHRRKPKHRPRYKKPFGSYTGSGSAGFF